MKLDSIQIGRAIAALAVVFFHSHLAITNFPKEHAVAIPYLYQYGFYGVQLFFAISGFIICHITDRPDFNRTDFFVKRFFRIYPLYAAFCLLAYYLQGTYALGGHDYSLTSLLTSIAIIPQQAGPIYAVGWSLEYEILFYVLAGLLIPIGGTSLLGGVLLALIVIGKYWQGWDYHFFSPMLQYFLVGIVIYKIHKKIPFLNYTAKGAISRALVRLGDISFSLYLVHWVVFAVANRASNYIGSPAHLVEVWRLLAIGVSIAAAFILWRLFEQPTVRFGHAIPNMLRVKKAT